MMKEGMVLSTFFLNETSLMNMGRSANQESHITAERLEFPEIFPDFTDEYSCDLRKINVSHTNSLIFLLCPPLSF